SQMTFSDPISQALHFVNTIVPAVPSIFGDLLEVCREADVIVSSPHQITGRMVHEKLNIPYATVHLSQFGGAGSKHLREASAPILNRCREREGLPPLHDPLTADAVSAQLALYAVSKCIVRQKANAPTQHVTGFFYLEEKDWRPDPALAEFVSGDAACVVVTFGSVVHGDPEKVTDIVVEALNAVGCRGVIQRGWSGLARRDLPAHLLAVDFVPHDWLFKRASCVVHHGGAGTTAAALRAGVPSVIVPHTLDQPIWAEFARALGCAGGVIPFNRLTAENLAAAISATLNNPAHRQAAQKTSAFIGNEDGVQTACGLIEEMVRRQRPLN
ncbi:MAG TPA: nucleotide disphospho-sugar-binding domain-containing protein, partial [Pyrinomonadaceae bacterium]